MSSARSKMMHFELSPETRWLVVRESIYAGCSPQAWIEELIEYAARDKQRARDLLLYRDLHKRTTAARREAKNKT